MTQVSPRLDYTQLIRDEYTSLQAEHLELRRQYDLLSASHPSSSGENSPALPSRLLQITKSLADSEKFADCRFRVADDVAATYLPAHRFLLAARSRIWANLERDATIEIADFGDTFRKVYRWMYSDRIELAEENDEQLMRICEISAKFELEALITVSVEHLSARLNPSNCVKIYEFAENRKLDKLTQVCGAMVTANWAHFGPAHFDTLPAPALYRLIARNTQNVLKSVIDIGREDVLFLFFIQNSEHLPRILNSWDVDTKMAPLELCLTQLTQRRQIAAQIIEKGANVNLIDANGEHLLMRAIRRNSSDPCRFLIKNGADVGYQKSNDKSNCAHILAETLDNQNPAEILELLNPGSIDILNSPNSQNRTPLMTAVMSGNFEFCKSILRTPKLDLNYTSAKNQHTALSLSLLGPARSLKIAEMLILNGAQVKGLEIGGTPILNLLVTSGDGLEAIRLLLEAGVDAEETDSKTGKCAVHLAAEAGNLEILRECLRENGRCRKWTRDRDGRTALDVSVESRDLKCAKVMIEAGANVNEPDTNDVTLLAKAILAADDEMAVFLIDNGAKADRKIKLRDDKSYLEVSCELGLLNTVRALISTGLEITANLLELALREQHMLVAELLVQFGSPLDSQLLHRFLDDNDQPAATFLIRAGCDVDARRGDADDESPLHIAVAWSMSQVLSELIARDANLCAQDANGRTAAHLAVREQNYEALEMLLGATTAGDFIPLRDKFGQTILSQAMVARDHRIAQAIVERQPHAAAQTNGNGENLLHSAIRQNDFESVLFLLAVARIDVSRPVQDGTGKTPLHLAAVVQNEMIIRNLILACEDVNSQSADGCTPLHDALKSRKLAQARILLENRANPAIRDEYGENAFLCAVRSGSVECVKLIQSETDDSLKFEKNKLGMTCLHLCALLTPDKMSSKTSSAEICELLLRFPEIDKNVANFIDARDLDGNTALMIAYSLGNAAVCRSLLRRKACMGTKNNGDVNVFTYETATKQLLLGLLESLECEPRWSDGDTCDCGSRFSLTQRKHHCRHCGRHVCSKCSETTMPIAKYGEEKRVRVCDVCCHVISGNTNRRI